LAKDCGREGRNPSLARNGTHLFRLGEIFYRKQLAFAFGYADAGGVHVEVEDVGSGVGRLHEALVDGGGVGSLVDVFGVTALAEFDRSRGLKGARPGAPGRKRIPRFTRNDKREVVAGEQLLLSAGRKQIPRFTRNDKREGGGRGELLLSDGWKRIPRFARNDKASARNDKKGPNTGSFDSVNGLASESIHCAQDDRVRNSGGGPAFQEDRVRSGTNRWTPAAASRGSVA